MNYNDIIMDALIGRGMDRRLKENPESYGSIIDIIKSEISRVNGKEIASPGEAQKGIEEILDRGEDVYTDPLSGTKRMRMNISINKDGSITIHDKTRFKLVKDQEDTSTTFSIDEKNGNLVKKEVSEALAFGDYGTGTLSASKAIKYSIFNEHGLEMKYARAGRSVSVKDDVRAYNTIKTYKDAYYAASKVGDPRNFEVSPITYTTVTRNPDLATEEVIIQTGHTHRLEDFFERDAFDYNKIGGPIETDLETKVNGKKPLFPGETPNDLYMVRLEDVEEYGRMSKEEFYEETKKAYSSLAEKSQAFRDTLLDEKDAVRVDDLQRVYETTSDRSIQEAMKSIIETSRGENRENDELEK